MRYQLRMLVCATVVAAIGVSSCSSGPTLSLEEQKAQGAEYLAKASDEPGAQVTASGLVYRELTPGNGPMPLASSTVRVHYRGTLIDGTEFDSSLGGEPLEFGLNRVIPCWTEGVQMMRVGGKSQLVCPSDIAYGDGGAGGGEIPGGAALIFEVELLGVQ